MGLYRGWGGGGIAVVRFVVMLCEDDVGHVIHVKIGISDPENVEDPDRQNRSGRA